MINRTLFGVVSLVVLAAFAGCSESPPESPAPTQSPSPALSAPSLIGTWAVVKFRGQPVPEEGLQPIWRFTDTEVLITIGERTFNASYTIDSSTVPNRITITAEGQSGGGCGIFNLAGDTLIIKMSKKDEGFAENFEPEEGYEFMEFRRKQ